MTAHIVLDVVVLLLVGATSSKKTQGSVVSNRIGMKFGGIVLQANMRRLSKLDFQPDV